MTVYELMTKAEPHSTIVNAFAKSWDILGRFYRPVCSISGGSDSDIMLHIIHSLDDAQKTQYIFLNTGLEYSATKKHLAYLEDRYNIHINRIMPALPVSLTVKKYGYPFLSKLVSQRISQLQRYDFDFKDNRFEDDLHNYPACVSAIKWWHNVGTYQAWNICRYKLLKEFLIANPPHFSISDKCCELSKKKPARDFQADNYIDLRIIGTRKSEGGIRQSASSCFQDNDDVATFRPLFWFRNSDKKAFEKIFHVSHSACYSEYGLKRTGCAGCPFNPVLFSDIARVKDYEDGIVTAAEHVFAPAYEYTKLFKQFRAFYGISFPIFK